MPWGEGRFTQKKRCGKWWREENYSKNKSERSERSTIFKILRNLIQKGKKK
jgi:hypothetical protein